MIVTPEIVGTWHDPMGHHYRAYADGHVVHLLWTEGAAKQHSIINTLTEHELETQHEMKGKAMKKSENGEFEAAFLKIVMHLRLDELIRGIPPLG